MWSMKMGCMGMHAYQIGPTDSAPLIPYRACIRTRENVLGQAIFPLPFLLSLLIGATRFSYFDPWLCCYWPLFGVGVG